MRARTVAKRRFLLWAGKEAEGPGQMQANMQNILRTIVAAAAMLCAISGAAPAQELGGLARIDPAASALRDAPRGGVEIELALSQGVPWRVFTLNAPRRLVVDFREVDWTGLDPEALGRSGSVTAVRVGGYAEGWSRMVADLDAPLGVAQAGLAIDPSSGTARLSLRLAPVTEEAFAAAAGAPRDARWDLPPPAQLDAAPRRAEGAPLVVVLDPGHGGIDPGAERDGISEKALMLTFARELRDVLRRAGGYEVVLTRDADVFVSLERRIAIAHEVGADIFLSLHADALSEGLAHGATVHVLSHEASDVASAKLAERHDRDALLAGLDLSDADDEVTDVLLDLARQETQPRSEGLARSLISAMGQRGGPMNRRPLRRAAFSVLKAADIPSALIEVGFLSSPRDLRNLRNPAWRARMAEGIRAGLDAWRRDDAAAKALRLQ